MKTQTKQTVKIFWQHAMRYPVAVFLGFACLILVSALRTYNPILYKNLINYLALNPHGSIGPAISIIVTILIANIIRVGVWRGFNFINNYFQPRVMADLLNTCYKYLQKHSFGFFSNNFVGSLLTRVKRYERSFEQMADQVFYNLGRTVVEISFTLGVLLWTFPRLGGIVLVWSLLYFAFSYGYARFKFPYDVKRAEADTKTTAQLADSLTNNINVKLFTGYKREEKAFNEVTHEQFSWRRKSWDLGTKGDIVQNVFNVTLEFVIIYMAVHLWQQGRLTLGDIVLLQAYLIRIFDILWDTGKNIRNLYESLIDAGEMTDMLVLPLEVQDLAGAKRMSVKTGQIDLQSVDFAYKGGAKVLKKFNLSIRAGERVALIGPSGGGKSTIVKLLLRFVDIQDGEILIDGQNIAQVTQDSLRDSIALVPQDPILFHRSLMDNIRYGRPNATDKEVITAAKLAHADEFISGFSKGYSTFVGERGVKLSGGERQRVAIARAILKNAPILILDEATSSLDSESEHYIQDALKNLMKNKTVIVIAHRLSTIMQMDRIIVLENGEITEEGKHAELLKMKQGTYQRLWQIQAGGFA